MSTRILSQSRLLREVSRLRRAGQRIVTTNGSFDLLHVGHVRFLQRASQLGDVFIVLLNSDASIRRQKGPTRPILPQRIRAEMMAALRGVDYVTIFHDDTPLALLRKIRPDVHAKGGSWKPDRIAAEKRLIESWGGKLRLFPMVGDYSTTKLIQRVMKNAPSEGGQPAPAEGSGPTTTTVATIPAVVGRVPSRGATRRANTRSR